MDKSLKVGEDEWREREKGEHKFQREKKENEVWTLKSNFLNHQIWKMHTQDLYL